MKNKITVLVFHPRLEESRVNQTIFNHLYANNELLIKDMYECYPDFNIDVDKEQNDLLASNIIVLQHPFYWYAAPPLVKQWIDLVFESGWAYGKGGTQLKNKKVFHIISSGGTFQAYHHEGVNKYTYLELLRPFELTYRLCGMNHLPPYIIPGANKISKEEIHVHALTIAKLLLQLGDDQLNADDLKLLNYMNDLEN